jgi:hypothetical protein
MGLKYFIWGYRNIIFCLAKIGYEKVFKYITCSLLQTPLQTNLHPMK